MRELMVRLEDMGEHSLVQDAKASLKQLFNDLKNKYATHPQIDIGTDRERGEERDTHKGCSTPCTGQWLLLSSVGYTCLSASWCVLTWCLRVWWCVLGRRRRCS